MKEKRENSLRLWLERVEEMGELAQIEGADWDGEIGCITGLNRSQKAPALLFHSIKGYPPGYHLLSSSFKTPTRISLTFNLPICASTSELMKILPGKLVEGGEKSQKFPPREVKSGPVMENVHQGDEINLLEFPAPKWHELDGGRYIGTGDVVITKNPETGQVNLGTYRLMVQDERTTGIYVVPGHHGRINYENWHRRGERCPIAVSLGHNPLLFAVSALPISGPEYGFAGAIGGEAIKVIKEEITGLPIPAESEIVLAGWCPPDKTRMEGPFGEWPGYYASKERQAPIIQVERIYHRTNPILYGSCPSRPPSDATYFSALFRSALLYNELTSSGVPDIKGVWLNEAAGGHPFVIISLKQRYAGHAKQAALLACQSQAAANLGRYVVVVDEDIDPTNINDVLWALCFRSDPEKDIDIIRRAWSSHLDPTIRQPTPALYNSRAIIDACKPYDWIDEFPKEVKSSPELVKKTKERWGKVLSL